jgi:hypothetical protein
MHSTRNQGCANQEAEAASHHGGLAAEPAGVPSSAAARGGTVSC